MRLAWMTGAEECDWKEDFSLENGNYINQCIVPGCGVDFIGHKRRVFCRRCAMSAKAAYDRMTPEEQAEHDRKREAEIREAFEQYQKSK